MNKHEVFHYIVTILDKSVIKVATFIISVLLLFGGYVFYTTHSSPYNLIFGIPLIIIGAILALNSLWTMILVTFSPVYNRGVCKLCFGNPKAKLTKKR
jgi:hypothetical protein